MITFGLQPQIVSPEQPQPPTDWQRVEDGLHAFVAAATGLPPERVVWSYGNAPEAPRPWAWLDIVSGPTPDGQWERRLARQVMLETYTVPALVEPGDYAVRISDALDTQDEGNLYAVEALGTETPEQLRDDLVDLLQAESGVTVDASPDTEAARFTIEGTPERKTWHASTTGPLERALTRDGVIEVIYQPQRFTLRLQIEADGVGSDRVTRDLMAMASAWLGRSSNRATLRMDGRVALRSVESPINLSRLVGDRFVGRTAQDFIFNVAAQAAVDGPWARTAAAEQTA